MSSSVSHPSSSSSCGGSTGVAVSSSGVSSVSAPRATCPTLTDLCLQHYLHHLEELGNLHLLPEPLVQQLLYLVYVGGGLTPSLVKLFDHSEHESIQTWLSKNIRLDRAYHINATSNCRASRY
jgi:hypothetical protein